MHLYGKKDVDKKALRGARIAVLGYGSQGRAHALNLKDSGFDVVVGVRKSGPSWKKVKRDGLAAAEPADAVKGADLVAMLVPDMAQAALYTAVKTALKPGAVRRRNGAGGQRFRDAGGSRLSARGGLLRVPARTQADRRSAARGRIVQDASVHQ